MNIANLISSITNKLLDIKILWDANSDEVILDKKDETQKVLLIF